MSSFLKPSFYDLNFSDLQELLAREGFNPSAASELYNWHYKKKEVARCSKAIALRTQGFLQENLDSTLPQIKTLHESADGTVKFLFALGDGQQVESVLIPFFGKYSLCISSQVGCAMNCSFCFTGEQGLKRNLTAAEMVGQFLSAWGWLKENQEGTPRILNLVFMGQGEPLHNFEAVKTACEIFLDQHGLSIGIQKITVSTAGYSPGLVKWAADPLKVNLALSLHSLDPVKRSQLIPMNKKYPLPEVLALIDQIPLQKKQFVTYEYLLIKDFNDGEQEAIALGEQLQGKSAYINLIPFNSYEGAKYQRPEEAKINAFKEKLDSYKIPTIIRTAKGDDVAAACGQLSSKK